MTEQFEDVVVHRNAKWTLYAATGVLLDVPALALSFGFAGTACWRGYCLVFRANTELWLAEFHAALDPIPESLFGAQPTLMGKRAMLPVAYRGLKHKVGFTGGVLLARIPVRRPLIRNEIYEFQDVVELFIEQDRGTAHAHGRAESRLHGRLDQRSAVEPCGCYPRWILFSVL